MAEAQLVDGRYRVLRTLGSGGMGHVYEAEDEALKRRVAVKVIRPDFAAPDLQERFTREARLLARLSHPSIVAVHDMGVHRGGPYLVMELLEGVDLRDLLAERGALGPELVRAVAAGMCAGLAAAHAAGVLHRDVKPSNVHLTRNGRVVLQDFGIAHLLDTADTALTATGVLIGTPSYLPPEIVSGGASGPHSDMYALGVCLYEMLTGRRPFASAEGGLPAILYHIVNGTTPPLRGEPGIPEDLAGLVEDLMAKDPGRRPGPEDVLKRVDCPSHADRLVAAVATGDLRDRAVQEFSPAETTGSVPRPPDPVPAASRPNPKTGSGTTPVTLSAATRNSILSAMTPQAAEAKQREAVHLVLRGSLEEAVQRLSGLAEFWRSMFGPDHPSTLTCEFWQGVCLARLGAGGESLAKFSSVATSTRRSLTQLRLLRLE
ncbi:serine/threonine-protein kinase [Streptomyces sp. NPDC052012]|uniref:serine/threonine-protein kinase n=1 Tax=Streptomyces sp. NPDC052012 TaxID=3155051 RepID=UPI00344D3941